MHSCNDYNSWTMSCSHPSRMPTCAHFWVSTPPWTHFPSLDCLCPFWDFTWMNSRSSHSYVWLLPHGALLPWFIHTVGVSLIFLFFLFLKSVRSYSVANEYSWCHTKKNTIEVKVIHKKGAVEQNPNQASKQECPKWPLSFISDLSADCVSSYWWNHNFPIWHYWITSRKETR